MSAIRCFLLEDLKRSRYCLRRYRGSDTGDKCPLSHGYHNAFSGLVEERPDADLKPDDPLYGCHGTNPPQVDHADPRWPARCACGYAFVEADTWQVWADALYRRIDTGDILTWRDAPAGAMREATWWPDKGIDGKAWVVKLPDGADFMTEGKANNCNCSLDPRHRCWTRSGTAPRLTVTPSIQTSGWHGYLTDGALIIA